MVKIAVDAMGGDNAPYDIIKGSVKFVNKYSDARLTLFGNSDVINKELYKMKYNLKQIEVIHTTEVITNDDKPMVAIKSKKDSSLVKALQMVKAEEAQGVISAGSTGALLTGATVIIGRIRGVKRPTLATIIPAAKGKRFILVDSGANVDSKPEYIAQYAVLGSIYMEKMMGIENPKVGIVNVGTEEAKGNAVTKEAFELLKKEDLNFVGNVESREIPFAPVDVVVCDGFTGNVILKLCEGLGELFSSELKESFMTYKLSKIGALLSKKSIHEFKQKFDPKKVGGAPIIGLKGLAVKAHGNSDDVAFYYGLKQCYDFIKNDITGEIKKYIEKGNEDE